MLNDLESNMDEGELSTMSAEVSGLSDRELRDTLAARLGLGDGASDEELDGALGFVEEPEVLSEEGTGDPGSTPDLGHRDDIED